MEPAFPYMHEDPYGRGVDSSTGMTLRDYFAGQFLAGYAASTGLAAGDAWSAKQAYKAADEMLKARGGG